MGPWTTDEINQARCVPFVTVLDFLGAYYKPDRTYVPREASLGSVRIQVAYGGRDFRFIFSGEKWVNELLPKEHASRGGGGTIDFVRHITSCGFVPAVKICLDALRSISGGRHG